MENGLLFLDPFERRTVLSLFRSMGPTGLSLDGYFECVWRSWERGANIESAVDSLSDRRNECFDANRSVRGRTDYECYVERVVCGGKDGCVYLHVIDQVSSGDGRIRLSWCETESDGTATIGVRRGPSRR